LTTRFKVNPFTKFNYHDRVAVGEKAG